MDSARTVVRPIAVVMDARAPEQIGRHARLDLRFGLRRGRTALLDAYAEPPLRIGRAFDEGDGLHMILASAAPGVFGGDLFAQSVTLESGAHVRLTSQSALQAHPSPSSLDAHIVSRYHVKSGASLTCLWDPMIPFPDARVSQRITLQVDEGATLRWSDAFMAGREARGERWRFASLAHELTLYRGERIAYLERYGIEPLTSAVSAPWVGGDASYFGSAIVCGEPELVDAEALHGQLVNVVDVHSAADRLEPGLTLVRLMGPSGVAFHRARQILTTAAAF
ncbi:MAG: urease accessory protein UreD [Vicinamibacterales bacterium]